MVNGQLTPEDPGTIDGWSHKPLTLPYLYRLPEETTYIYQIQRALTPHHNHFQPAKLTITGLIHIFDLLSYDTNYVVIDCDTTYKCESLRPGQEEPRGLRLEP